MIEYGLSVSLNTTPRPRTPSEDSEIGRGHDFDTMCWAPRKRQQIGDDDTLERREEEEEESISPCILFTEEIPAIARRLDFDDVSAVSLELSPSSSFRTVVNQSNSIEREECCIGECSICYLSLPKQANHIFTLCGHLFCVRCLLKWWDTNTTCPLCRAEIYEPDSAADDSAADDSAAAGSLVIEDHQEDNEDVWIRRELWNGRHIAHQLDEREERASSGGIIPHDDDQYSDRTTDESDDDDVDDDHEHQQQQRMPRTQMNQYLFQDVEWNWSIYSPHTDDTTIPFLTPGEIFGLRENREIATTLFARSRFRDTLLQSNSLFMGRVWNGVFVRKQYWTNPMLNEQFEEQRNGTPPVMFEIVIRRESTISPLYEINIFGFMKDVIIIAAEEYGSEAGTGSGSDMYHDDEWENRCEYAFVANVFTPTDFYIDRDGDGGDFNMMRSYGSYDITEGIINTDKLVIPFSQIRRLYRLTSHEQLN
jgi:hypothetical protein